MQDTTVTPGIAATLHVGDAGGLARLRTLAGVQILEQGQRLWLWARSPSDELDAALRRIPMATKWLPQRWIILQG